MDGISLDSLLHIFSHLGGRDLSRVGFASPRLLPHSRDLALWSMLVRAEALGEELLARRAAQEQAPAASADWRALQRAYRRARAVAMLENPAWRRLCGGDGDVLPADGAPLAQEGHASALVDNRYWVVIGGYGDRGIDNGVSTLDTWLIDGGNESGRGFTTARVLTASIPPVYGHTACAIGPRSVAVVGGVQFGGYSGDVVHTHFLRLSEDCSNAEWEAGPPCQASRAYCSLSVVTRSRPARARGRTPALAAGSRFLVAFGGMHEGGASNTLEFLDLGTFVGAGASAAAATGAAAMEEEEEKEMSPWFSPPVSGAPPPPRFGHSSHWHAPSGNLLVVGGSTGGDLLRDGEDHYADHVHLLHLNTMCWTSTRVISPGAASIAGRCHCACAWGDADTATILVFGGSRHVTAATGTITLRFGAAGLVAASASAGGGGGAFRDDTTATCERFDVRRGGEGDIVGRVRTGGAGRPGRRLSMIGVRAGGLFLVHGGWRGGNLGDTFALQLDVTDAPAVGDDDDEEEEEDELDDEDESRGQQLIRLPNGMIIRMGDAQRVMGQQLFQRMMYQYQQAMGGGEGEEEEEEEEEEEVEEEEDDGME